MKNRNLQPIIISVVFLGLMLLLFYYFKFSIKHIIALCGGGVLIGLVIASTKAFLVPPVWAFKKRFGMEGLLLMIPLLLLISLLDYKGLPLKIVLFDLIFGGVFGYFLMGTIYKAQYNKTLKKITFNNLNIDNPILTDLASFIENDKSILGKLILTNQKLIFIPVDNVQASTEIDLLAQKPMIKISYKFGMPNGFIINEDFKFSMSYPKLWINKIKSVQQATNNN